MGCGAVERHLAMAEKATFSGVGRAACGRQKLFSESEHVLWSLLDRRKTQNTSKCGKQFVASDRSGESCHTILTYFVSLLCNGQEPWSGGYVSKDRGFESQRRILDGHFSHSFVVKIVPIVCLKRRK